MGHRRVLTVSNVSLNAFADAANFTDQQYVGVIKGGGSTQVCRLLEAWISGMESTNSRPVEMRLAYDSTVAVTATGGNHNDAPEMGGNATAPGTLAIVGNGFTTKPQRGTNRISVHAINCYGGGWKWQADDRDPPLIVGQAVNIGEVSYSAGVAASAGSASGGMKYEIV
jgi:hypothetical protein